MTCETQENSMPELTLSETLLGGLRKNKNRNEPAQVDALTGESMSFRELLDQSVHAAEGWRSLGLSVGDMVAVFSRNKNELFPAVLGLIFNGCTVAYIVTTSNRDELKHALDLCNPKAVLSEESYLQLSMDVAPNCLHVSLAKEDCPPGVVTYQSLVRRGANANPETYRPAHIPDRNAHISSVMYSSGTTGLPKGVMSSELCSTLNLANMSNWTTSINERHLVSSQLCWASGILSLLSCTTTGASRYFMTTSNEISILESIEKWKINRWVGAPAVFVAMASTFKTKKYDLSSITYACAGGASMSAEIHKKVSELLGITIVQSYGATEVGSVLVSLPSDFRYGSLGREQEGVQYRLVDIETQQDIDCPNKVGEIRVKSQRMMKGYIGNEKETAAAFDEQGFYKMGDLVYFDEDGNYFFVDRCKEVIKFRNQQISPAEIEAALLTHPEVIDACVLGKAHLEYGDLPTAFIVRIPGSSVSEKDLDELISSKLSDYKRLRGGVTFMDTLPKTVAGKTSRRELKRILAETRENVPTI